LRHRARSRRRGGGIAHPHLDAPGNPVGSGEVVPVVCTLSPQRIILGGGVMDQGHLFPLIRREVVALLNGYLRAGEILYGIDSYIVSAGLGNRSGRLGALAMAAQLVGA
jgi:fructokinase